MAEPDVFTADPGFTMVPADTADFVTADDELDAAEAALLEDRFALEGEGPAPVPFGRTWAFDWSAGRFHRVQASPIEVRGEAALREWLQASLHIAAGAHPILPETIGMEAPNDYLGSVDPTEALADFEQRLVEAWTQHDRVVEVTDVELLHDPRQGIIFMTSATVVTDQDESIELQDLVIGPGSA